MYSENTTQLFSFGYRCSSAGILKSMGLKYESFPFDWLISRLHVIKHCIEDEFHEFLNQCNYVRKYSKTYETIDSTSGYVCDEHLMVNHYYQPETQMDLENAYGYNLAMNHHNMWEEKDHEYYTRCVERFMALISKDHVKTYIHINPVLSTSKYENIKDELVVDFIKFDEFMYSYSNQKTNGIFFIMVKQDAGVSEQQPYMQLLYSSNVNNTRIYSIFTNSNMKDAGEIFINDNPKVVGFIKSVILSFLM